MKTNRFSRLKGFSRLGWNTIKRRLSNPDMFKRTQNKLTLQYSAVLMAFLILFIASVYILLYFLLITEQKKDLSSWISASAYQLHESMEHTGEYSFAENIQSSYTYGSSETLSIVKTADGEQICGSETSGELCSSLTAAAAGWQPNGDKVSFKKVNLQLPELKGHRHGEWEESPDSISVSPSSDRHDTLMLIAAQDIYDNGTYIGTLYVGKDVSSQYSLFRLLFLVLIAIAVLFCGLAVFLSRKMSVRAMIPIRAAYTRQREFVADASHELRTPLSVIQASIDTLEMEDSLESDPFAHKVLGHMKEESKRMTSLLGSMLTLARSDDDTLRLNRAPAELEAVAGQTVDSLVPLAKAKSIRLGLETPDSCNACVDSDRIKQLMLILLDNALKYTPEGGEVTLSLKVREDKRMLFISVTDNGIGIPAEEQQRIFERFYRVDKSRTRELGGHGLGLSIARWITEAHGGQLSVASATGQGSTFTAAIPLVTA
ncbi:sensor histidine kinase [Paenibacillus pinistramenti]|uniref:sensor histidine kinase n=1 Tax=Paenibacillus pinistramenti TaxID=1768003 RepID=UPI001108D87C|nr:ATP-binding protein [Paenibacillus pinistramenti]